MRPAARLLLLLAAVTAAPDAAPDQSGAAPAALADQPAALDNATRTFFIDSENRTIVLDGDGRILPSGVNDGNDTIIEEDGEHEPVVRKKRTFGDIVFRGLADVLGYSVARKQPQVVFPPPLAPVPGIDTPLLYVPASAAVALPLATQAVPAAPAAPAPCGAGRAAPAPCRSAKPAPPPAPKAAPPCPRPRAAPRPKPKPTRPPPPPPPPPCPQPRANPATPSPCAPAPAKQPAPPAKQQADSNLERISSNFQLNFNFNRGPATQAPAADEDDAQQQQQEEAQDDNQEQFVPIAIQPQAARLPQEEPRKPRVYVDAFVVRNGVPQRVDAVDAKRLNAQSATDDDDFLAYDQDDVQEDADDYEDIQESRDHDNMIREFGNVVDRFWEKKKMMRRTMKASPSIPIKHYQNVHFGDRDLNDEIRLRGESHQSLQREGPHPNRIPLPIPDDDDDAEATTTTEDPRKSLRPRVLPPTEQNPNQIDTVTVRVPPIYREKRPRKLHRENHYPERDHEDSESTNSYGEHRDRRREDADGDDTDGDDSSIAPRTERPRRKRRRKQSRRTRSVEEREDYKTDDEFEYFGKKIPISDEEKYFAELTVPPPTKDSDVLRHEKPVASGYFLEDHERLRDDPSQRLKDDPSQRIRDDREKVDSSERTDDKERADDKERSAADPERAGDDGRGDEGERSDKLSPNARVTESGYQNKFARTTNVQVDKPRHGTTVKRKTVKTGKA